MILEEKVKDLVVVGEDTSKKAKISGDKLAKLQYLLTKGLYKDPITAVIAEWTNNGIDGVVQAGKNPIENPVMVKISKTDKGQYLFSVEDKGTGLDDRDFEDVCMNYLESTKEADNDTIGHFGIGMKSFLSLERSATFTCRKNGIERKYLVYEGAEFVNYDMIYQKDTDQENGVMAELMINNWSERESFVNKAKAKLAYYDTAVLIIDNAVVTNDIYRNDLFQWSTLNQNSNMHLSLKDVYYTIDWEALGTQPINVPVALRLNLGDGLTPTPSRESYITNEKTKELLLSKIREVADWFVNKYNETVKEFGTFIQAYQYLGETNFFVRLQGEVTGFLINPLLRYSKHKVLTPRVKDIKVRNPHDYKIMKAHFFWEYNAVGYMNDLHVMKTKEGRMSVTKEYHVLGLAGKTVLVGDNFKGNVKDFLKDKYGPRVLYVRRNLNRRKLGTSKDLQGYESYRSVLNLTTKPRSVWRAQVEEFNFVLSSIVSTFIDERLVEDTKAFQSWLEDKKEVQRKKRLANKISGNYQGLNKQVGDVTLAYSYNGLRGISFKKQVYRIEDLPKNHFLTVMLTEDEIEKAKLVIWAYKGDVVKFALVGKKEMTKVPKHYQFINFNKFMSRDCKPFMRLASAFKFEEALKNLEEIGEYKNGIFQNFLKSLNEDYVILKVYVDKYLTDSDEETKNAIIEVADEHNLYDRQLWDIYVRLQGEIKKYDFINLLKEPDHYNTEVQKKYDTLITQILLFRKKYYNDLPEGTKIVFEEQVATI